MFLAVGFALVALAAPATAQVADPAVSVVFDDAGDVSLGAANTTTLTATVTNDNERVAGTVTFTVTGPAGWTIVTDPPAGSFTLQPLASAPITITLTAPEAGVGDATGNVELAATITENVARASTASGSASVGVTRVDPVIPPPPPAPWYTTTPAIAAFVLIPLALVGLAALLIVRSRNKRRAVEAAAAAARVASDAAAAQAAFMARETGITIQPVDGPVKYGPKRELVFRAAVSNVSDRPRVALVNVAECAEGWTAAVSIPRMPLSAGERMTVTVYVNPSDAVAPDTPARFVLTAKPEEAEKLDERLTLECIAPPVRIPLHSPTTAGIAPRVNANQPGKRGNVRP
jgi:hypothetical protein